jgi:hypothetical protein
MWRIGCKGFSALTAQCAFLTQPRIVSTVWNPLLSAHRRLTTRQQPRFLRISRGSHLLPLNVRFLGDHGSCLRFETRCSPCADNNKYYSQILTYLPLRYPHHYYQGSSSWRRFLRRIVAWPEQIRPTAIECTHFEQVTIRWKKTDIPWGLHLHHITFRLRSVLLQLHSSTTDYFFSSNC